VVSLEILESTFSSWETDLLEIIADSRPLAEEPHHFMPLRSNVEFNCKIGASQRRWKPLITGDEESVALEAVT
jgi:hypothetical protein